MKHKIKRVIIASMAVVCALSSTFSIGASALSSNRSVGLKNGYTHKLAFNVSSSTGTSTFSISNGGPCDIKNSLTAIEYTSGGTFVRNVSSNASLSYTQTRTCTVSRSSSSNVLRNYVGIGYNSSSSAKSRVSGNSYFKTIEIGDKGIETNILHP